MHDTSIYALIVSQTDLTDHGMAGQVSSGYSEYSEYLESPYLYYLRNTLGSRHQTTFWFPTSFCNSNPQVKCGVTCW